MNYEQTIDEICNALNTINTTGLENMNKMLGVYTALQQMKSSLINDEKAKKEVEGSK